MKMMPTALFAALAVLLAMPVLAQDDEAPAGAEAAEGEDEPVPTPTQAVKVFDCAVDVAGERCTVPISEGDSVDGVVAYQVEHTAKWVDFGRGPFNREGQPHGCDWVLTFRERLVEESGCFEEGKRHGTWETCRLRLNEEKRRPDLKCPKTEYEHGVIVVKPKEPDPELADEGAAGEETEEGAEGEKTDSRKPETKTAGGA